MKVSVVRKRHGQVCPALYTIISLLHPSSTVSPHVRKRSNVVGCLLLRDEGKRKGKKKKKSKGILEPKRGRVVVRAVVDKDRDAHYVTTARRAQGANAESRRTSE